MDLPEFVETIRGAGEHRLKDGRSYPITLSVTYSKYVGENLDVSGVFPTGHWADYLPISYENIETVSVEVPYERTLRLIDPWIVKQHQREIDFQCSGFTLGTETPILFTSGKYYVHALIPSSPLLESPRVILRSALGTIEDKSKRKWDDGIAWDTPLGTFLVADFYHWEDSGSEKELLTRVKVVEVRLEGEITEQVSPPRLLSRIEESLREPLILLSFLSRRLLHWHEIKIRFSPPDKSEHRPEEFLKRRRISRGAIKKTEPLLHYSHLKDGSFGNLLNQLDSSPMKRWLHRAMIYAVSSYHEPTVETQVAMIYLAAEALTEGFAQHRGIADILARDEEDELAERIRGAIKEFCTRAAKDANTEQQLLSKVQGFGRTSLKRRLSELISHTKVRTDDLWPEGVGLAKGLQGLIDRRNQLVHRAELGESVWPLVKDLYRLQSIVERSILELLGWDSTRVHPAAYSHNAWLRKDD